MTNGHELYDDLAPSLDTALQKAQERQRAREERARNARCEGCGLPASSFPSNSPAGISRMRRPSEIPDAFFTHQEACEQMERE